MTEITTAKIQILHTMLSSSSRPVIITHMKPDGDAMGSSLGMYHMLKHYGKAAKIAVSDPAPSNLDFLIPENIAEDICICRCNKDATLDAIRESDLLICLDFNAFHRTDTLEIPLKEASAQKILIDHHLSPDTTSFDLIFSKTDISSASELLYHILLGLPDINGDATALPAKTAEALMTGMTTDTNNFANSVYPSTFMMASALIAAGVDRDMILKNIYNRFTESRIRLQGYILKDLMQITPDGVAYVILDKDTLKAYDVKEGDTEGFVNIPLTIDKIMMSILIKEDDGYARVSIRSKNGISANMCSRLHFNGGGHENAAGGRLYIPSDIEDITEAATYIEEHTHKFMTEQK